MTIMGVTGGSGAGKTTALGVLADMGAVVIDCDMVYHALVESSRPMLGELAARFPGVVVDGKLERKALGRIVFSDPAALADLSAITHSYVCRAVDAQLAREAERGAALVAIEAIALIESGLGERCDVVVGVVAPIEERVRRITAREGLDPAYATARIKSQKPDAFFEIHCDYILENTCLGPAEFAEECRKLFDSIV